MRYITERELRDGFSRAIPESYEVPRDAKLTPAARQYLMDLRLLRPGEASLTRGGGAALGRAAAFGEARAADDKISAERSTQARISDTVRSTDGCLSGAGNRAPGEGLSADTAARASSYVPEASACRKPEHMTHLTRSELVCKANPRIELRGKLDSLEAELLLTRLEAPASFHKPLEDAMELVRLTLASDVKEEPLPDWKLDGMTAEQVHRASHHPEEFGFPGHITPRAEHGRFAALLNRLRAMTRECELCAVRAFWRDGVLERGDAVLALNRLSSYFYVLQLRAAAGKDR